MEYSGKEYKLAAIASHIRDIKADKYRAELFLLIEGKKELASREFVERLEQEVSYFSTQIEALEIQYKVIELE